MRKTIGIIGGMGPLATADLFQKIVQMTDANTDQEQPRVLIDSNSNIPSRIDAILGNGVSPVEEMQRSAKCLEASGADFLIIACNTAHYYIDDVRPVVSVPILNMPELTADYLVSAGIRRIGLLVTDAVKQIGLYDKILSSRDIEILYPDTDGQAALMDIVFNGVKSGKQQFDTSAFEKSLKKMFDSGAENLLLGCTELPVAFKLYGIPFPCIDPTTILAQKAIELSGASCKPLSGL